MAREILRPDRDRCLHTFSAVFPDLPPEDLKLIDERSYVEAVVRMGGIEAHTVRADRLSPLHDLDRVFWHMDEAPLAPNLYMHWGIFREARRAGVRILLDGIDGDSAVGHGWGRLDDLVAAGQWDVFAAEARAIARNHQQKPEVVLSSYGFPHLERMATRGSWLRWARGALAISRRFSVSRRRLLREYAARPALAAMRTPRADRGRHALDVDAFFIAPEFALRIELERHWSAHGKDRPWAGTERQGHVDSLRAPIFQYGLEMIDRAAAAFGLEPRYPYFDRRLMEFCVGLPPEQKLADGWSRRVLRLAMEGILPKQVQWRPDKARLSPNLHRQFFAVDAPVIEAALLGGDTLVSRFIAVDRARSAYERARGIEDRAAFGPVAERLYQPVTLASWLQRTSDTLSNAVGSTDPATSDDFPRLCMEGLLPEPPEQTNSAGGSFPCLHRGDDVAAADMPVPSQTQNPEKEQAHERMGNAAPRTSRDFRGDHAGSEGLRVRRWRGIRADELTDRSADGAPGNLVRESWAIPSEPLAARTTGSGDPPPPYREG
jgi:asparagine synthase (glutamine-hydrolysing)